MTRQVLRLLVLLLLPALSMAQPTVNVGSKRFTESYIVGEIAAQTMAAAGEARVLHQQGLGNTAILFTAAKSGAIHAYPEYTGTIALEILRMKSVPGLEELDRLLAPHGLAVGIPLGFGNTYALAMLESRAAALGISTISDLAGRRDLRLALSQEFLNRRDGWASLRRVYQLRQDDVRGLDHGLAYEAIAGGSVDVIDVYSTDAKISRYRLRVLQDDRGFFPSYEAVILHRREFPSDFPRSWAALQGLAGSISTAQMIAMNAAAEDSAVPFGTVAERFLAGHDPAGYRQAEDSTASRLLATLFAPDLWRLTLEHLVLVLVSLALGIAVGVPLGICADKAPRARGAILAATGVLQTVPALALLAFLIAALDRIGTTPAIVALFLYALLPIVRNTEAGLGGVSRTLKDSATALGLTGWPRLRLIELPLAAGSILAGIKTSAVINVGTATIAAFIGAGGYGERIVAGLAVNDHALLLAGAIPAAAMAIAVQWAFDILERRYVSPGGRTGLR